MNFGTRPLSGTFCRISANLGNILVKLSIWTPMRGDEMDCGSGESEKVDYE